MFSIQIVLTNDLRDDKDIALNPAMLWPRQYAYMYKFDLFC